MLIGSQGDIIIWDEKIFLLLVATSLWCLSDQKVTPECVRYELHESSNSSDVVKSLTSDCISKKGFTEKLSIKQLSSWPTLYNVTFECCSKFTQVH